MLHEVATKAYVDVKITLSDLEKYYWTMTNIQYFFELYCPLVRYIPHPERHWLSIFDPILYSYLGICTRSHVQVTHYYPYPLWKEGNGCSYFPPIIIDSLC